MDLDCASDTCAAGRMKLGIFHRMQFITVHSAGLAIYLKSADLVAPESPPHVPRYGGVSASSVRVGYVYGSPEVNSAGTRDEGERTGAE